VRLWLSLSLSLSLMALLCPPSAQVVVPSIFNCPKTVLHVSCILYVCRIQVVEQGLASHAPAPDHVSHGSPMYVSSFIASLLHVQPPAHFGGIFKSHVRHLFIYMPSEVVVTSAGGYQAVMPSQASAQGASCAVDRVTWHHNSRQAA
jgi:hypothetical protein